MQLQNKDEISQEESTTNRAESREKKERKKKQKKNKKKQMEHEDDDIEYLNSIVQENKEKQELLLKWLELQKGEKSDEKIFG